MRPPAYAADRYPQHHETHDQDGNGASGIGARMNSGSEDPPSSGDDQDQGQGVERGAEERQQGQEGYTLQAATGGSAGTASGDGSGGAGGSGSGSGEGRGGVETPTPIGEAHAPASPHRTSACLLTLSLVSLQSAVLRCAVIGHPICLAMRQCSCLHLGA